MKDVGTALPAYRLAGPEVTKQYDSRSSGLSVNEAQNRLQQYGVNSLHAIKKDPWWLKYLRQFKDGMILLLVASSGVALYLDDGRTALVLAALVLFNTLVGFSQEYKAERIMESLEKLVVPEAKVVRAGTLAQIRSTELVPGDVVYIEAGDSVPADLRLLDESELSTNDFALTGESNPSRKFTHALASEVELADRHNLVFMGTTVATGHAHGLVIGTGMQTELGRIANLSQDTQADPSPLQKEMNNIAKRVTQGTVVLCAILVPLALNADLPAKDAFLVAIGIAASLVPNGLPAAISTVLARAANKLAKDRALVKKLSAVETLGATSIIFTDKTGTLTKNEMTVEQLMIGKFHYQVSGTGYEPIGEFHYARGRTSSIVTADGLDGLQLFFAAGALASNAQVNPPDEEHAGWHTVGDPTEGALITLARKAGLDPLGLDAVHPELKEFAFDSVRKRMSSVRTWGDNQQLYVFMKGAPESILETCDHFWDHGLEQKLNLDRTKLILDRNEALAKDAMRNLALAYKILPANTNLKNLTMEEAESGMTYLGMVSMIDPLREEVKTAMAAAHRAHIKVSMITGDHATTARAIAQKAGLGKKPGDITLVAGHDLRAMDDAYILKLVESGSVIFSRVSPEDKLRIVNLVKDSGQVVAVTGDGINDAPALKRADIGVAMGRTGTDVAKQSAEIVLLDDSFHTLVNAVQEGRTIFANIKKIALMCFTANASELFVNLASLGGAILFKVPLALTVMLILAVDLIAELFPVAALGWDKADHDVMTAPPRDPKQHILSRANVVDVLWAGLLIGGLAYANYLLFFHRQQVDPSGLASGSLVHLKATAMTYLTIVLCQLGNILQRRSERGLFTTYQFHNKQLWLAMCLSLFCVINIIYNPWIAPYFRASSLAALDWIYALAAAAIFLAVREFQRYSRLHSRKTVHALHPALQNR